MNSISAVLTAMLMLICPLSTVAQKKNIATIPPMGWNTWNSFHCDVNEQLIRASIDKMVSSGMREAGYQYIVIDDCWQKSRDENGRIVPDPERFPSGMKALADYAHSNGLKFGLYSDAGRMTCQRRPGSLGHEKTDARTYQEWGVDYLKFDWCYHGSHKPEETYQAMGNELAALDRDIVFSICDWGKDDPWKWAPGISHLWRTTGDIIPKFSGASLPFFQTVVDIIDKQADLYSYAGPGAWNDPDMMEVGNGLTASEDRAHFTMWCMMAAPLMAGNDLRNMSSEVIGTLTNKEMIAIDQDPLGKQAQRVWKDGQHGIWVKELQDGQKAICFFNRSRKVWALQPDWEMLNINLEEGLRDLWEHQSKGAAATIRQLSVAPHDIIVFRTE